MKKIMLVFFAFILVNSLFAYPFGLRMGMTLDEIAEKCGGKEPEYVGRGAMYNIDPIKKDNHFVKYVALVHDDLGLFGITAYTKPEDIEECKLRFKFLYLRLSMVYGEGVKNGSDIIVWIPAESKALEREKLCSVSLSMESDGEKKCCGLFYMFENYDQAKGAISPF